MVVRVVIWLIVVMVIIMAYYNINVGVNAYYNVGFIAYYNENMDGNAYNNGNEVGILVFHCLLVYS